MGSERTWAEERAAFEKWAWEREGDPIGTLSPANAAQAAWFAKANQVAAALSAQEEELGRLRAELLIDRAIFDRRWEHDEVKRLDAALEGSKR